MVIIFIFPTKTGFLSMHSSYNLLKRLESPLKLCELMQEADLLFNIIIIKVFFLLWVHFSWW